GAGNAVLPIRRRIDLRKPIINQNRCCKNGGDHRFFIAKVSKRERDHRTGKVRFYKHHKVIWIQSFITDQHMIWAATGDMVNRFMPQAFGNIN
ncbi:hypothetical protein, partial [Serratia ficaria]|uniref:hypothetical protein n=1 Tax=Serratia ficaria TaxID=61651 RepID=UPI0021B83B19